MEHLEDLTPEDVFETGKTRFPVQTVIRPKTEEYHDFRGYAGKLYGNTIKGLVFLELSSEEEGWFNPNLHEDNILKSECSSLNRIDN